MLWCIIFFGVGLLLSCGKGKMSIIGTMMMQTGIFWMVYILATGHITNIRIGF